MTEKVLSEVNLLTRLCSQVWSREIIIMIYSPVMIVIIM